MLRNISRIKVNENLVLRNISHIKFNENLMTRDIYHIKVGCDFVAKQPNEMPPYI